MSKYLFYSVSIFLIAFGLFAIYVRVSGTAQTSHSVAGAIGVTPTQQVAQGTATPGVNKDQAYIDFMEWLLGGMTDGKSNNPTKRLTATDHYNLGYTLLTRDKNYSEAINEFTLALGQDPYNVNATYARGLAYVYGGRSDLGMQDYDRALQLKPDYVDVYISRGDVYRLIKYDYTRALADYKQAIKLNLYVGIAYEDMGLTLYDMGEDDSALTAFDKAIQVSPMLARAYNERGLIYSDMDNSEMAVKDFTQAIKLLPKYGEAYKNRAWEYDYMKKSTAAIADFKMVLQVSDNAEVRKEAQKEIEVLEGN